MSSTNPLPNFEQRLDQTDCECDPSAVRGKRSYNSYNQGKMTVEMLEIKLEHRAEKSRNSAPANRWIAVIMSPTGSRTIAHSPWREFPSDKELGLGRFSSATDRLRAHSAADERYQQEMDEDRMMMIGQLLADGWEPVGTDQHGRVVTMKRVVP